ncbi:MAG: hypothetical protein P8X90_10265 [Desulfobacterales bacterium]|jgi:hypothetical protein
MKEKFETPPTVGSRAKTFIHAETGILQKQTPAGGAALPAVPN